MRGRGRIGFTDSLGCRLRLYLKNTRSGDTISGRALAHHVRGPGLLQNKNKPRADVGRGFVPRSSLGAFLGPDPTPHQT